MTDHYQTLGVTRNASQNEIKAAYRKGSSSAHPDKGGSAEQQAALNRAWAILGDAEQRAKYDATGEEPGGEELSPAKKLIIEMIEKGVLGDLSGNWVDDLRKALSRTIANMNREMGKAEQACRVIEKGLKELRFNGKGSPFLREVLLGKESEFKQFLLDLSQAKRVAEKAEELLQEYEYTGEPTMRQKYDDGFNIQKIEADIEKLKKAFGQPSKDWVWRQK